MFHQNNITSFANKNNCEHAPNHSYSTDEDSECYLSPKYLKNFGLELYSLQSLSLSNFYKVSIFNCPTIFVFYPKLLKTNLVDLSYVSTDSQKVRMLSDYKTGGHRLNTVDEPANCFC